MENSIDSEIKMGMYKLDNGDLKEAEKIFEKLAVVNNIGVGWIYLGIIKFKYFEQEQGNVAQILKTFQNAQKIVPEEKKRLQDLYYRFSIDLIKKSLDCWNHAKREKSKNSGKMWGNLTLGGISLLVGNNTSNRTLGTVIGSTGAGMSGYHASKNISQKINAKQAMEFYSHRIQELTEGIEIFCEDNDEISDDFDETLKLLKLE